MAGKQAEAASPAEVIAKPFEVYRAEQYAQALAEAKELAMDTAPAGGRYIVDGQVVDANGVPVKDPTRAEQKAAEADVEDA